MCARVRPNDRNGVTLAGPKRCVYYIIAVPHRRRDKNDTIFFLSAVVELAPPRNSRRMLCNILLYLYLILFLFEIKYNL